MTKIKGLYVKKSWAKVARKAQFELVAPDRRGQTFVSWPRKYCGIWTGCCAAIGHMSVEEAFAKFFGKRPFGSSYWWPVSYRNAVKSRDGYTARIIALETFALYCEEHGV